MNNNNINMTIDNLSTHELKALRYAENYGIVEYTVNPKNNTMIYYDSYRLEKMTYKCIVNLNTMQETRTTLKQYYPNKYYN